MGCYLSSEDSEVEIRENGDGVLAVVEGREKNLVMVRGKPGDHPRLCKGRVSEAL